MEFDKALWFVHVISWHVVIELLNWVMMLKVVERVVRHTTLNCEVANVNMNMKLTKLHSS